MAKLYKKLTGTISKSHKHSQDFVEAVKNGDMEKLKKITHTKVKMCVPMSWNGHDREAVYPIHVGSALGSCDVLKFLFRCGATLETKTDLGLTPLHFAAGHNHAHPEVVELLLDMGAKPGVKDKIKGYTPFHYACDSNNFGAAKRLLAVTKPTIPDHHNKTAKDIAIENDCEQIVELFEKWDQEQREKEELRSLPERLSLLERKTEVLLRHQSIQSMIMTDSGMGTPLDNHSLDGADGIVMNSTSNLLSLRLDKGSLDSIRQKCHSAISLNKSGYHCPHCCNRKSWATPGEEDHCQHKNCPCAGHNFRDSLSPVKTTLLEASKGQSLEEDDGPVTRDSPITKVQRHQVQRNYSTLQCMMKPDRIIPKLFAKFHLDLDAKEKLSKMATQKEKNDHIISEYVLRGTIGLFEDFLESLHDTQQGHLADRIARVSDSPLYTSKSNIYTQVSVISSMSRQNSLEPGQGHNNASSQEDRNPATSNLLSVPRTPHVESTV